MRYFLLLALAFSACDTAKSPIALKLISPVQGKEILPEWDMPFFWTGKCDSYKFTLAKDAAFTKIEKEIEVNGTGYNYRPQDLYATYYWKVKCGREVAKAAFKVPKGVIKTYLPKTDSLLISPAYVANERFQELFQYQTRCQNPTFKFSTDSTFKFIVKDEDLLLTKYALGLTSYSQFLTDAVYYWQVECPLYISPLKRFRTTALQGDVKGKSRAGISQQDLGEEVAENVGLKSLGNGKISISKLPNVVLKQTADPCSDLLLGIRCPSNLPLADVAYVWLEKSTNHYKVVWVAITLGNGRSLVEMEIYDSQSAVNSWKFSGEFSRLP